MSTTSASDLLAFISASPSPYHCVAEAARRLEAAGFTELAEGEDFGLLRGGDRHYVRRDGSLVAFVVGVGAPAAAGYRIVGAHTDSPGLRLKPLPDNASEGYRRWGVEVYGGALLYTWFDRDLGLAGRVMLRGSDTPRLLRIDRPIARVPSLAIHLNRQINEEGFKVNTQSHLPPVLGLLGEDPATLRGLVAQQLDCAGADILGFDLSLFDVSPPSIGGVDQDFVFAPRLDNQASCYAAIEGICSSDAPGDATAVAALFDHEECGSLSATGADSAFFELILRRVELAHEHAAAAGPFRAAGRSLMVSADMAHGVHPNYADRHEPQHKPMLNGGVVIKTNVNNRYATTGVTAAAVAAACEVEGVGCQNFVTRTDLACGTTIGPIGSARLAIPTVDVGCAMLSMHSIREMAGAKDVTPYARVIARLLST